MGMPERVDHPADQLVAHGDLEHAARSLDLAALVQVQVVPQDDRADGVFLQVQRQPEDPGLELQHLHGHGPAHAVDPGNAVAQLHHRAHLVHGEVARVAADLFSDPRGYLFKVDPHLPPSIFTS